MRRLAWTNKTRVKPPNSLAWPAALTCLAVPFSLRLNVFPHPQMYPMNDEIRPNAPILRRPDCIPIRSGTLQSRPPSRQRRQRKLPVLRVEVSVKMGRLNMSVRGELVQWRRTRGHAKTQQPRLIPDFNRLNERPR